MKLMIINAYKIKDMKSVNKYINIAIKKASRKWWKTFHLELEEDGNWDLINYIYWSTPKGIFSIL